MGDDLAISCARSLKRPRTFSLREKLIRAWRRCHFSFSRNANSLEALESAGKCIFAIIKPFHKITQPAFVDVTEEIAHSEGTIISGVQPKLFSR